MTKEDSSFFSIPQGIYRDDIQKAANIRPYHLHSEFIVDSNFTVSPSSAAGGGYVLYSQIYPEQWKGDSLFWVVGQ
jgi:hypothetical protein